MEQVTMNEAILEIKINQLNNKIKELEAENFNLKQIILWQSYDKVNITPNSKSLVFKKENEGRNTNQSN